ncbi:MAG: sigma-70 family RNA polymerase sigma factor [bacterium]
MEGAGRVFAGSFPVPAPAGPSWEDFLFYNRRDRNKEKRSAGPEAGAGEDSKKTPEEKEPDPADTAESESADDSEEEAAGGEWASTSGEEDRELIDRFLKGEDQAFNRLVLKYQNKAFNLCYRFLGDPDEAEDMAQEVFMTVHKSLPKFRGDSLFSTWLFRITVNHCKNRIKFLGRRRYYQSVSMDQPQETEDGDLYHEVEDESPDPESALDSRETQDLVQEAISRLEPEHRLVIVLRDIEDVPYEEIAEMLGIKVGTVKSRIHRGRSELKSLLEKKVKF